MSRKNECLSGRRALVQGAGSIGTHHAQALRRAGAEVDVIDPDSSALERMRLNLYPNRYGAWDPNIGLYAPGDEPGGYDLLISGTPPDVRNMATLDVLGRHNPELVLLEKPLCSPNLKGLDDLVEELRRRSIKVVMGYDHAVAPSVLFALDLIKTGSIGEVMAIEAGFCHSWDGILAAHSWLPGPHATYLGYTERGGGASGEHSHALHLAYVLTKAASLGDWKTVSGVLEYTSTPEGAEYDRVAIFCLATESGKLVRVTQDLVTEPERRFFRVQGSDGFVEWLCAGGPKGEDMVRWAEAKGGEIKEKKWNKVRPDDFYAEMVEISRVLSGEQEVGSSNISLASGLEVMKVLRVARDSYLAKGEASFSESL